jgi:hypothetical protein
MEKVSLSFQYPWGIVLLASVLLCGIASGLMKRFQIAGKQLVIANIFLVVFVNLASGFFSYSKLSYIRSEIEQNKELTLSGSVTEIDSYNAKDIVFIADQSIVINYSELYCVSGSNMIELGDEVVFTYINLGPLSFLSGTTCVVEIDKTKKSID